MNNHNLQIYSSIYDVIESHQLKKHEEYHGRFFLTPTSSIALSAYALLIDNAVRKINKIINSLSSSDMFDEQFTILPFIIGLGIASFIKDQTTNYIKFKKIKYSLDKKGININGKKISIRNLKKAQTVTYYTYTDKQNPIENNTDYITRDLRAIVIKKRKTKIIIKEQKTYCLENNEFEPTYSISILPNSINTKNEKNLILKKAYQKYGK